MKQGSSKTTVADYKVEPKSKAVNPAAVADMGIHQIRTKSITLYPGRGLEAPMVGQTNHKCGSQGKH